MNQRFSSVFILLPFIPVRGSVENEETLTAVSAYAGKSDYFLAESKFGEYDILKYCKSTSVCDYDKNSSGEFITSGRYYRESLTAQGFLDNEN